MSGPDSSGADLKRMIGSIGQRFLALILMGGRRESEREKERKHQTPG